MIVLNRTALAFGTKVTSRQPPRPEMVVVVKGTYRLAPGEPLALLDDRVASAPSGDRHADGDDDRTGPVVYPSDFADFKPRAEVIVMGTCHTPRGRALTECEAGVSLGTWSKRVRVVGPRRWVDDPLGSHPSDPVPFTSQPLGWEHAFGGPEIPENPVGRGPTGRDVPHVEALGHPVRSRGDRPRPGALGPTSPTWPERAAKLGKSYGKEWRERRAPWFAEDFDWSHFQSAAPDQWLPSYPTGDEELVLENLFEGASRHVARLPGLRVRVYARSVDGTFRGVPMVLDTIVADTDRGRLSLVWRGLTAVSEPDLSCVRSLLVATEKLGEAGPGEAAYLRMLEAFEADPVGIAAAREEMLAAADRMLPAPEGPEPGAALDAASARIAADLPGMPNLLGHVRRAGAAAAAAAAAASDAPPPPTAAGQQAPPAIGADPAASAMAGADDAPPPAITNKPGAVPPIGLRRQMRLLLEQAAAIRARLGGAPVPPEIAERLARLEAAPHDPSLREADPDYTVPLPLSADVPGPYADLVDHDLTGRDLSGLDLRGAKLDGALLTRANLAGANLAGASLRGAVCFRADLTGADLHDADLTRANFARAKLGRAVLAGACVEQTFFEDADLRKADLRGVRGEYTACSRADLSWAQLGKAALVRPDFTEAILEGAVATGASLPGAVLADARAAGLQLTLADVRSLSAEGADLSRARFDGAQGSRVNLTRANLEDADFSLCRLRNGHLTEARARRALFFGADLRDTRLYRADLSGARFHGANLFSADLSRARLDRTSFVGASLYDAKLLEAYGEGTDFTDAHLARATVSTRRREGAS